MAAFEVTPEEEFLGYKQEVDGSIPSPPTSVFNQIHKRPALGLAFVTWIVTQPRLQARAIILHLRLISSAHETR